VVITDDCSGDCKFSWSRISTFSLTEEIPEPKNEEKDINKPEKLGIGALLGIFTFQLRRSFYSLINLLSWRFYILGGHCYDSEE